MKLGVAGIVAATTALLVGPGLAQAPAARASTPHTLRVPLDHDHPRAGSLHVEYDLGAPFDARRPTVFVVADAQQFYVRAGAMAGVQADLFGPGFNVVGLIGRSRAADMGPRITSPSGTIDWSLAWRFLNSRQWVGDLESLRRHLLGPRGRVLLYGRSGGAFLVHEYLARHGQHVRRAFTSSVLLRQLDAQLGFQHDRFWQELGAQDERLRAALGAHLAATGAQRPTLIKLLQRQNFFVPVERLAAERAALVQEILASDQAALARRRESYQVDAVAALMAGPSGPGIRVRLYEFVQPLLARLPTTPNVVRPNIENEADAAEPLLALQRAGRIPAPRFDAGALHDLRQTEVFVLAGRHDHTADYRSQMVLAAHYPRHSLLLADDGHQLERLDAAGLTARLAQAFLRDGLGAPTLQALLAEADALRWREGD
jgi:hypothetical protein